MVEVSNLVSQYGWVLLFLLAVSEALPMIPGISANGWLGVAKDMFKQAIKLLGIEKK